MIKLDKAQQKIAFTLFVVGVVATSMLAVVDRFTQTPIADAKRAALHKSLQQVLPEHSNDPLKDSFMFPLTKGQDVQIFPAKDKKGDVIAYAWEQVAPNGYSGSIRILMGIRVTGEVVAIRITEHRETPGLGDGITHDMAWLGSFMDKTLSNAKWAVKKDGGDFDQFTGATITPRAVVQAVFQGLKAYEQTQVKMLKKVYMQSEGVKP